MRLSFIFIGLNQIDIVQKLSYLSSIKLTQLLPSIPRLRTSRCCSISYKMCTGLGKVGKIYLCVMNTDIWLEQLSNLIRKEPFLYEPAIDPSSSRLCTTKEMAHLPMVSMVLICLHYTSFASILSISIHFYLCLSNTHTHTTNKCIYNNRSRTTCRRQRIISHRNKIISHRLQAERICQASTKREHYLCSMVLQIPKTGSLYFWFRSMRQTTNRASAV